MGFRFLLGGSCEILVSAVDFNLAIWKFGNLEMGFCLSLNIVNSLMGFAL
jgi:hypothetical protein